MKKSLLFALKFIIFILTLKVTSGKADFLADSDPNPCEYYQTCMNDFSNPLNYTCIISSSSTILISTTSKSYNFSLKKQKKMN